MSVTDRIQETGVETGNAPAPRPAGEMPRPGDSIIRRSFVDSIQSMPDTPPPVAQPTVTRMPLIGRLPVAAQQRILLGMIVVGVVGLVLALALILGTGASRAQQQKAAGQAAVQVQRLVNASGDALFGAPKAFLDVKDSAEGLLAQVKGLATGGGEVDALDDGARDAILPLVPVAERLERNANVLLSQQKKLTDLGQGLALIGRQAAQWAQVAELAAAPKAASQSTPAEIASAGQLAMLTQRIVALAAAHRTPEGLSDEQAVQLSGDLKFVRETAEGLAVTAKDPQVRERLQQLVAQVQAASVDAAAFSSNLPALAPSRTARATIVADAEPMRRGLELVLERVAGDGGAPVAALATLGVALLLIGFGGAGFLRVYVLDQSQRARNAEAQRLQAERQERDVKQVHSANQKAILRLMDELQNVAAGDLTQQATVSEDITGAIADSVNYTVEELRNLVSQVHGTVTRVTETTELVDQTSTELLAASSEQLREIRDTGEAVLRMAERINDVSSRAQRTADVARQSLKASESGLVAVQNTIEGMNSIRDQIQDTAKRIKRLGESSQEIGEITELISDITEQTNVLALNAAIQAASAGEAGRGFSVVAEEVQRLAERSADATRQIAALVKAIQTDTQDAVAAMERSTQGVVEGARLSDKAGTTLVDIDRVTRELSDLILRISDLASREADSANVVATNIQHIFAVTEQASDGTRSTAQMVRELSHIAEELRESVARFKIA